MVLITMLFQVVARNKLFTNSVSGKNSFLASSSIKLFVALLGKSISRTYVWFSYCSMTLKIFTVIYSTQANSSVFQTVHFLLFRILRSHWYWRFDRIYDFFFFIRCTTIRTSRLYCQNASFANQNKIFKVFSCRVENGSFVHLE